ncbi:MAG TPA: arylsulfatase [Verrucomicrobiales bacterium]|nr:arylsulfatase [Verrucomicrobiales bacterium]
MLRLFSLIVPAFCLLAGFATSGFAKDQPNIIYFLADDLGWTDVGWHGSEIRTPNLDKLANGGAKLEQFYVLPVCSPTRAALMTGRYPIRHGLQVSVVRPWAQYGLPLEERTLPQALKEAGYTTHISGKWHLGHFLPDYLPTRRGFDTQYGHYNGALDYFTHDRDGGHDWHRNDKDSRDEGYTTILIGNEAVRVVEQAQPGKPFFLYVPFNAPHSPLQAPDEYLKRHAHLADRKRQAFAAMVECLDEQVGRVVAALEKRGLVKDTLILFSSDNGGPLGLGATNGSLRAQKGTLYEGGTRVCAFANWAGRIKAGTVVNEPLHIVDWFPTLVKLTGAPAAQKTPLDGLDIWPVITAGKPSPHEDILINATPGSGAIRMGEWKLVLNGRIDANDLQNAGPPNAEAKAAPKKKKAQEKAAGVAVELFKLADDPYERNNLAGQHPEVVQQLREKIEAYQKAAVPPKAGNQPANYKAPRVWGE